MNNAVPNRTTCRRCCCTVLLVLVFALPAQACLNDRDTLAEEVAGMPEISRVITGRFERNPPLYYQMRIDRIKSDLARNPGVLDNYDDIAVACDRLGRDDEAIGWIEKKHALLPPYAGASPEIHELWYRYYANCGTFWVHRWFHSGADRKHLDDVRRARDLIAKAVAIKPDAHFGREKYQSWVIDWIIKPFGRGMLDDPTHHEVRLPLSDYIIGRATLGITDTDQEARSAALGDAARGLSGLVALGGAWESPDIFDALSGVLAARRHGFEQMSGLAALRCRDLIASGHHSLTPDLLGDTADAYWDYAENHLEARFYLDEAGYHRLRAEADNWQARRTSYMMARLQANRHPDTDPAFWNDWHESGPPALPYPLFRRLFVALGKPGGGEIDFVVLAFFGLCFCSVTVWFVRQKIIAFKASKLARQRIPG